MPGVAGRTGYFLVVETQKGPGMRYSDSILGNLLKPIRRRWFDGVVDRHGGNAYGKSFGSWDHLVALIYAQLGGASSLRGLEASWNANAHHHYHLGVGKLARSTLADANGRRPLAVFSETFAMLSGLADRLVRREGCEMVRLIDSTPIPLGRLVDWARGNGRVVGLKLHVVYDPLADNPSDIAITDANVNDIEIGRQVAPEPGCTYVFDKAYCRYDWWSALHEAGARFVTRRKTNSRLRRRRWRPVSERTGDGFTILSDAEIEPFGRKASRLTMPMRQVRLRRDNGETITLITNDFKRTACQIAALYRTRWQIELLFRWIKQHLRIKTFLGRSPNAIKLQIVAAMIAYVLLRIAARQSQLNIPALRFAELLAGRLFSRTPIQRIDKPNLCNPPAARPRHSPDQIAFAFA
jgi:IS4 transposase